MKFTLFLGLLVAGSALISHGARAQQSPDARSAEQQAIRQALVQKIEQVKYEKMKTALALDDATAQKFFTVYKPAEKDIQGIVKERNDELKKLALMMNGAKSDADVDPEMQKIRDLNQQIGDREQKLDGDLKPVLSPRQRARLLVFEHAFNQRVREQLAKGQGLRRNLELRRLRRQLREQRLKNRLLRKHAAKAAAEHP